MQIWEAVTWYVDAGFSLIIPQRRSKRFFEFCIAKVFVQTDSDQESASKSHLFAM